MITKNFSVSKLKENAKSNQLRKEKKQVFFHGNKEPSAKFFNFDSP